MKKLQLLPNLLLILFLFVSTAQAQYKQTIVNKTQLLFNKNNEIPFGRLDELKIAVAVPSVEKYSPFIAQLDKYAEITPIDIYKLNEQGKLFNTIIVAGTTAELQLLNAQLVSHATANKKRVVVCRFQDSDLSRLQQTPSFNGVMSELVYPEFSEEAQRYMAMSIFGGLAIGGNSKIKTNQTRLQYTYGERSGLNIAKMTQRIDAIAAEAIREKAAPGMVVMVVKNGQVIFEKAYGHHTYENARKTSVNDIFDLASVSKIAGTTPVIMHLTETKAIHLDSTIGRYIWEARETNKKDIKLRTVLLHEAGFTPYIPFYRHLKPGDLQRFPSPTHQVQVADSAYLRNNYYEEVMWPEMLKSAVKPIGNYVYSDISMYVMKEVAENVTHVSMDTFVNKLLYKPIGMKTAGYNPRRRFDKSRIVPTEHDTSFRKVLLEGFVHDQGAAMAGGLAGHAGLFATANDLAIYGQLLLNRGEYGGVRYFKPETVDLFTSKQSKTSRRGLGFDRYDPDSKSGYPSKLANPSVYGHTGYTGTCIWIDPQNQLIYIFLSNRVHPQVSTKLLDLNIRSRIQDVIYETINESK